MCTSTTGMRIPPMAAAMAIDAMRAVDVVGTLGGDDTVFVVMRDTESAERFSRQAHDILK